MWLRLSSHFVLLLAFCYADDVRKCGGIPAEKNQLDNRVLGGHVAAQENWPFVVQISQINTTDRATRDRCFADRRTEEPWGPKGCVMEICAGSLISPRHVLTATHCVVNWDTNRTIPAEQLMVSFGQTAFGNFSFFKMAKEISLLKPAEEIWVPMLPREDDMAVIELEEAVSYSDSVQPVCLPLEYRENVGEYAVVVGYGAYNFSGSGEYDGVLRENIVPFRATGKCLGDSGGPLLVNRHGQWFEVGLCVGPDLSWKGEAMYNRITPRCDWIQEVTDGEAKCMELP